MKTTVSLIFVALGLFVFLLQGCGPNIQYNANPERFNYYLNDAARALQKLDEAATRFQHGQIHEDSLRAILTQARLKYKSVEFYFAYSSPEFTSKYLNGAPLLKINKSGNQPTVVPPEGLQMLDELIYSENPSEEKVIIAALSKKVNTQYNLLANALKVSKPNIEDLILASRLQLVRIFTLGLTGFDTPGSVNGLQEAGASLQSMQELIKLEPLVQQYKQRNVITSLFEGAIEQLQGDTTFESFDRLAFLRNYIDPLYKELGTLPISINSKNLKNYTAWNPNSTSIFAANFLDPYFYTQLKESEDSQLINTLGADLFYDPLISRDAKMSCASCHNPDIAFTDGKAKSLSNIEGITVLRNSPTLLNAVYAKRFFYDARAFTLEQQLEHVIFDPKEFNTAYAEILQKLNNSKEYKDRFDAIFGKDAVTRENLVKALASYVLSLQSFNSSFDQYARRETEVIPTKVSEGFNIFMGKGACATCHFAPTFSGLVPPLFNETETEILGVLKSPISEEKEVDLDEGRWKNNIAGEYAWIYEKSFKTPTVRNIEKTAPYFHNGAYESLEQVMDFYNQGGGSGLGLDVTNQTLPDAPLDLLEDEIDALIAFMNALTDTSAAER